MKNKSNDNHEELLKVSLAFISGSVCVLSWAPWGWSVVSLLSYGSLAFLLINNSTIQQTLKYGFAFGIGLHVFGHSWVFNSLFNHAHAGIVLSTFGTSIFVIYLSLFTAVPIVCAKILLFQNKQDQERRTNKGHLKQLFFCILFAASLTLGEYLRSLFFNGFTGLSLAYAFVDSWPKGWIPIVGTYGCSFLAYLISAALALACLTRLRSDPWNLMGLVATPIVIFWCGGLINTHISWVTPMQQNLSFRLIQANVQQSEKFDPTYVQQHITDYLDLITSKKADLIATPETAFPVFLNQLPVGSLERLSQFTSATSSHIFLGVTSTSSNSDGYNTVLHLQTDTATPERYDKTRLMPFGEYSPRGFRWFTQRLSIPLKDLSSGANHQRPFLVANKHSGYSVLIGTLICHEDLVGTDLLQWLPQANLLLNPSNLAWFEGSLGLDQRTQIVQARALEAGRPILRVANTGLTAHIDHLGILQSQVPMEQKATLEGHVTPMSGSTPFAKFGNFPILTLILGICAFGLVQQLRRFNKS